MGDAKRRGGVTNSQFLATVMNRDAMSQLLTGGRYQPSLCVLLIIGWPTQIMPREKNTEPPQHKEKKLYFCSFSFNNGDSRMVREQACPASLSLSLSP